MKRQTAVPSHPRVRLGVHAALLWLATGALFVGALLVALTVPYPWSGVLTLLPVYFVAELVLCPRFRRLNADRSRARSEGK